MMNILLNLLLNILMNSYQRLSLNDLIEEDKYIIDYWRDYIDYMASNGAIFVVSAGNYGELVEKDGGSPFYPCLFDNVICVGAIDNAGLNEAYYIEKEMTELYISIMTGNDSKESFDRLKELIDRSALETLNVLSIYSNKIMNPEHYKVASFSNYGKKVEIYAPGHVEIEYRDVNGVDQKKSCQWNFICFPNGCRDCCYYY
eukprot:jgi/Orpsp1_1/1178708/evm.model.c7180000066436.1